MSKAVELYWISSLGGEMPMGEYPSRAAAEAAIPVAKDEAIAQCATDEERAAIEAGTWSIVEIEE